MVGREVPRGTWMVVVGRGSALNGKTVVALGGGDTNPSGNQPVSDAEGVAEVVAMTEVRHFVAAP